MKRRFSPSRRFADDLSKLMRAPSESLRSLRAQWPQAATSLREERRRVLAKIPTDDPINASNDLLGPLNSATDENHHTRALAYLFDPFRAHGLGRLPLVSFLDEVRDSVEGTNHEVSRVLLMLRSHRAKVVVIPERRHILSSTPLRGVRRTDVWIEIRVDRKTRLIVIENKIRSKDQKEQLNDYTHVARDWCKRHANGSEPVLIFLTRDIIESESARANCWLPFSYAGLACSLRRTLRGKTQADGSEWLRLYIASLAHGVLGLTASGDRVTDLPKLRQYLGRR